MTKKLSSRLFSTFQNITIHGLHSMFCSVSKLEILIWFVVLLTGVIYYASLLYANCVEYNNQYVMRTIDTIAYPVTSIPFPAITLCNFNIVYKPRAVIIEKLLIDHGISAQVAKRFIKDLILLKYPKDIDVSDYRKVYRVLLDQDYDQVKLMRFLAQPCSSLLKECYWKGSQVNCTKAFRSSKSEAGICCAFNYNLLSSVIANNSLEDSQNIYTGAGSDLGLFVTFNVDHKNYVSSLYNSSGALVYMHGKDEYPGDTASLAFVESGKEVSIKITPIVNECDSDIRNVAVKSRLCLFENEGSTFWAPQYGFENCMQLCRIEIIAEKCKCIPYYYPTLGKYKACTLLDVKCLKQNEALFGSLTLKMYSQGMTKDEMSRIVICNCLPACSYEELGMSVESIFYKNMTGGSITDDSAIRVYFRNSWCVKHKLVKRIDIFTFIANVGGVFSLCLGGSIISMIQLLYAAFKSAFIFFTSKREEKEEYIPQLYWSELIAYPDRKKLELINFYDNFIN